MPQRKGERTLNFLATRITSLLGRLRSLSLPGKRLSRLEEKERTTSSQVEESKQRIAEIEKDLEELRSVKREAKEALAKAQAVLGAANGLLEQVAAKEKVDLVTAEEEF